MMFLFFFFQAEDGIRDLYVTGVQTCALPISAYEGEVYIDGRDARRLGRRAVARLVAFVPQKPETPPALTVAEYVLLGRTPHIAYRGGEGRRDREAAAQALRRLELEAFAERPLGSLSGGELQRAVLA